MRLNETHRQLKEMDQMESELIFENAVHESTEKDGSFERDLELSKQFIGAKLRQVDASF